MTTSKLSCAAAAAATLTLALTACGGGGASGPRTDVDFSGSPTGSLSILGYNPSDEVGKSRSDLAAENLPDVDVQMDTSNFDPQKFAALSASGDVPDLIQIDRTVVGTYAAQGLIMPMDACFEAHGVDPSTTWYDAVTRSISDEDGTYAVPQFYQPGLLIFNQRVMDEAGVSVDQLDTSDPEEFLEAVTSMNELDGTTVERLGFDPDIPGSLETWFAVFGGSAVDENGAPTLDTPENIRALEWIDRLMEAQGGYEEVTSFKQTWDVFGAENQFVTDSSGGGTWAQWYVNVLADAQDDVDLVGVPLRAPDGSNLTVAGGSALAIPAAAQNPEAACAWAVQVTSQEAWMAAGEARHQVVQENGSLSTGLFTGSPAADEAIREAYVTPSGNEDFDQLVDLSYEILPDNTGPVASPVGQRIKDNLGNAATVALTHSRTPQEALQEAQASAQKDYDNLD